MNRRITIQFSENVVCPLLRLLRSLLRPRVCPLLRSLLRLYYARRRRFTAKYKLEVLEQADRCEPGQLGALLRREGLYSSHLTCWRRQREAGALAGLAARQRGRPAPVPDVHGQRVAELERENARLRQRAYSAESDHRFRREKGH